MTPEEWKQFGGVLVTWGFWIIVYGFVTMGIGIAIISICKLIEDIYNKPITKILR